MDMSLTHMWESMGLAVKLNTIFMILMSVLEPLRHHRAPHYVQQGRPGSRTATSSRCATTSKSAVSTTRSRPPGCTKVAPWPRWSRPVSKLTNKVARPSKKKARTRSVTSTSSIRATAPSSGSKSARPRVFARAWAAWPPSRRFAPFVGLFGTVLGIINAFQLLKGGGGMDVIGPGIAEALISTAFGLLVAIPAAMFFNYFTGRVETMAVDVNDVSSEFIDYVLREGRE